MSDQKTVVDAMRRLLADQFPASVTFQFPPPASTVDRQSGPECLDCSTKTVRAERISHSPDFSSIRWADGQVYSFTPRQRPVVAMLWEAMVDGVHFVGSGALLEAAEVNCSRMRDLFRESKAWGVLIVQGLLHGGSVDTYRLAPVGDEAERAA